MAEQMNEAATELTLTEQITAIDKDLVQLGKGPMKLCLGGWGRNIKRAVKDAISDAAEGVEEDDADDEDYIPPAKRIANDVDLLVDVAQQLNQFASEMEIRLQAAMTLLERAGDKLGDSPPDKTWWRQYLELTGEHYILEEEGWEHGSAAAEYLRDDPDWEPFDEVNAPKAETPAEVGS